MANASEKHRELRQWYLSHGICPACRKNDVATGFKHCPDCIYKFNMRNMQRDLEVNRERNRKRYADRRASGLCVACGKEALPGQCRCSVCASKNKVRARRYKVRSTRHENGICMWCDQPALPGRWYCEKHYQQKVEIGRRTIVKAREALGDKWRRADAATFRRGMK